VADPARDHLSAARRRRRRPALATGASPAWFAAVGVPRTLLSLAGTVALARSGRQTEAPPRRLAAGIALSLPSALILAELGGSAIAAIVRAATGLRWIGAPAARPSQAIGTALP
jgi:hypothetical protein